MKKHIRAALTNVYCLSRRFGLSERDAETTAQVVVEGAISLVPALFAAVHPAPSTVLGRVRLVHLATCWGSVSQTMIHPVVREWLAEQTFVRVREAVRRQCNDAHEDN